MPSPTLPVVTLETTLEESVVVMGSYLFNGGDIDQISSQFLMDLHDLLLAEIELSEATVH